jgi:hypothetical protein
MIDPVGALFALPAVVVIELVLCRRPDGSAPSSPQQLSHDTGDP